MISGWVKVKAKAACEVSCRGMMVCQKRSRGWERLRQILPPVSFWHTLSEWIWNLSCRVVCPALSLENWIIFCEQ